MQERECAGSEQSCIEIALTLHSHTESANISISTLGVRVTDSCSR